MRKTRPTDPRWSDVTPKALFLNRRGLMLGAGAMALAGPGLAATPSRFSIDEPPTDRESVTSYNNFYEFGFDKSDPKKHAGKMVVASAGWWTGPAPMIWPM